ncbi:lipoate--protein ligase family protein [Carboxylicivirga caseinilyticus]|uniref:lipoate--protein ligase family protein n=1 Tax=Carboxylicivirga caseinilyticus TaxID=3417572 RepID=UPI003D3266F1|nr:lipoate--protein ligase [Marinilabiliaceae bacterium A049]
MRGILSNTNDPAFNLATEEFLLRKTEDDVFFLYVNQPSIIVGKHQNALAEINFDYTHSKNIPVYRRLSGGGTVYHDLQNLNFCFIKSGEKNKLVNFALYSKPILEALTELGIQANFGKRHDIQIDNKKISGNASHVFKSRVMHHGTLLFNSELDILNNALRTNPLHYKDKAVKSVRSEVTNISEYVNDIIFQDFISFLFNYLLNYFSDSESSELLPDEIKSIEELVKDKYTTDEWNFGYSPNYEMKKRIKLADGSRLSNSMKVSKGKIVNCVIKTNNKDNELLFSELSENLNGTIHLKNDINIFFDNYIKNRSLNISKDEWLQLFF